MLILATTCLSLTRILATQIRAVSPFTGSAFLIHRPRAAVADGSPELVELSHCPAAAAKHQAQVPAHGSEGSDSQDGMPRDMTGMGRYPPTPRFHPFIFYSCARLGDPEMLAKVMAVDPYFITQDNGAGAPLHFATTNRQLDMVHHLLNLGAEINQRDQKGMTPLHRAAYLSHLNGYLEIYEYLLSRGADPNVETEDYEPYLNPGRKTPIQIAQENMREKLAALEEKYKDVPKKRVPHADIGDWWALYDYGQEHVAQWARDYAPLYPEVDRRAREEQENRAKRLAKRAARLALSTNTPAAPVAAPAAARPAVPPGPIAFLFPGQGSQAVGMLSQSKDLPAVKALVETANRVLGYDLLDVCQNGPKERLDDTVHAQPALLLAGMAAVEVARQSDPKSVDQCAACAGLSLGEYSALVFAGAMSFEDAMRVVKVRAEAMAEAAKMGQPHGMLSVIGLDDAKLEAICAEVRAALGSDTVCQIANKLFPQGRVVSGHKKALDEVQKLASERGALKTMPLAVSGAFHTPLMQPAREKLAAVLEQVEFREPRIPVFSNVTARPFESKDVIRAMLARQLVEPVQWERTLVALTQEEKKKEMYELGPGQQIKAMVKRIDNDAWKAFKNVAA